MAPEIRTLLKHAARRLLARRALETAALGAIAAALACAICELGWVAAIENMTAAAALCAAPVAAGAILLVWRPVVSVLSLSRLQAWACAAAAIIPGALCLAGLWAGYWANIPAAFLPLAFVPLAAAAGALAACARGVSQIEAAILADHRLHLRERLATAAELDAQAQAAKTELAGNEPFTQAVFHQAFLAAKAARIERASFWSRGRATAGALGLAVLLCLTLAMLPGRGLDAAARLSDIASAFPNLSSAEKLQLADALRRAAADSSADARSAAALAEASIAAQADDPDLLRQKLKELAALIESGDVRLVKIEGFTLPAQHIQDVTTDDGNAAATLQTPQAANAAPGNVAARNSAAPQAAAMQTIFNPDYAGRVSPATGAQQAAPASAGSQVPFDLAWDKARRRAEDSIRRGDVPDQYRHMVEEFFVAE
jgi:hypothetical protein